MTTLIKNNNRTFVARAFRESLDRVDPAPEYLYMFIGRNTAWDTDSHLVEVPETPTDNITTEFEARAEMYAIKRVTITDTALVVPRYNWTTSTVYDEYDADDTTLFTKDFYVLNSSNNVYKCLSNNSGAASTVEPTGTSTSSISTGDGYSWKFMYNLSSTMIATFLDDDWLPVPHGDQKTSFQTAVESSAAYAAGSPPGGHGFNAASELGARRVMVVQSFVGEESGTIDATGEIRQFGLISNPLLVSTGEVATGSVYSVNDSSSDINENSGSVLYIDNREVVSRATDQSETAKIILRF